MAGLLTLLLYIFGILYIILGTLMLFVPDIVKKQMIAKLKKIPIKKLSIIPLIVGVLLLLASAYNRYWLVVVILGILALAKGIMGIVATEKMEKMHDWFIEKADKNVYRICGVIVIILGSIVLIGI